MRTAARPARPTRALLAICLFALSIAACRPSGASMSSPATSVPASSDPAVKTATTGVDSLRLVVIGDSIPFADFCPGCTGFVDLYARDLEARTGRPVEVANRSRNDSAGIPEIHTQVTKEERLRAQLAEADIVIVSVGFNNAMPDAATNATLVERYGGDWGCSGDMGANLQGYVSWALATTPECRQTTRDAYAALYDDIFPTITELRAGAPTVFVALNVYDANLQGAEIQRANLPRSTLDALWPWMIEIYDQWNAMLCDRATDHGFTCVDTYHAFNGPDGVQPIGPLSVDGAHPSQAGNDLIAELLREVDIAAITE